MINANFDQKVRFCYCHPILIQIKPCEDNKAFLEALMRSQAEQANQQQQMMQNMMSQQMRQSQNNNNNMMMLMQQVEIYFCLINLKTNKLCFKTN